ncbi:MAG: type II toxin-antitoxin system HicA family toxin [Aphanothece sp. CMT-3BRIN-NPC111]|nr:type II toxin-antitoxin system HicA family toxin [Aphanothece sp. CMT-3BRIN-NPC111]
MPVISSAECVKALEQIGFVVDRQRGSHIIIGREDPITTVSVPAHKELDRGTLRAIIRKIGFSDEIIKCRFLFRPNT